jgi:hypothetical protein
MVLHESVLYEINLKNINKKKLLTGLGIGLALGGTGLGLYAAHEAGEDVLRKAAKGLSLGLAKKEDIEKFVDQYGPIYKIRLGLSKLFGHENEAIAKVIKDQLKKAAKKAAEDMTGK